MWLLLYLCTCPGPRSSKGALGVITCLSQATVCCEVIALRSAGFQDGTQKDVGTSSTSSHTGGAEAYVDDVTEAARLTMSSLKILRYGGSGQPVGRAAHKYGSYKECFFYNRLLCSGISLDSPASKRPRPI